MKILYQDVSGKCLPKSSKKKKKKNFLDEDKKKVIDHIVLNIDDSVSPVIDNCKCKIVKSPLKCMICNSLLKCKTCNSSQECRFALLH